MEKSTVFGLVNILTMAVLLTPISMRGTEGSQQVSQEKKEIYTPAPKASPRINGPLVYGCTPGKPFLYRIPCQGDRPVSFSVKGLPNTLKLDPSTGIISGITPKKGSYTLVIKAENPKGKDSRELKIIAGDKLALTPP
ncbi:MAG TPA: putative Ig domain-containing protein, partial [Prolixibacteraceae bacterium]|nr:putative Ig domain-containing protein [Prolixibacteraceae bacterium]